MDQKVIKKFRKRKDLDKLLMGNARKHFRRKSGHMLLRTESQSSLSSDDLEKKNYLSAIRYKRSRCSSCTLYISICLSICTLILCCVLFGLTFLLRSHMTQLNSEVQSAKESSKMKTNELQEIYSHLQTLQVYIHHLNRNVTQQSKLSSNIADRFNGLEKRFKKFEGFEPLLGSLSNVPSQLHEIRSKNIKCEQSVNQLKGDLKQANQRIQILTTRISSTSGKSKTSKPDSSASNETQVTNLRLNEMKQNLDLLRRNVTEVRAMISDQSHISGTSSKSEAPSVAKNKVNLNLKVFKRLDIFESQIKQITEQLKSMTFQNKSSCACLNQSKNFQALEEDINRNKESITSLKKAVHSVTASNHNFETMKEKSSPHDDQPNAMLFNELNSTLFRLIERLPKVRMTLGFGVAANSTFKKEPLGHGVILKRDEYYKLRSFWAKASNSFTLSIQSQQRVDIMEKKFKKLKKQVIDAVKDITVLQAVGLKPTDKPGGKNHPEIEINVPVPVYTTPRNPNAPTPDPHLKLPWVKSARDAEINFLRWNRNGDDALSGEELDPAALRGFMGPYTPSLEQMMHYDVNNDHRLSKQEVLCLFGYIPWPCTGDVVTPAPLSPRKYGKTNKSSFNTSPRHTSATKGATPAITVSPTTTPHVAVLSTSSTYSKDDSSVRKRTRVISQSTRSMTRNKDLTTISPSDILHSSTSSTLSTQSIESKSIKGRK